MIFLVSEKYRDSLPRQVAVFRVGRGLSVGVDGIACSVGTSATTTAPFAEASLFHNDMEWEIRANLRIFHETYLSSFMVCYRCVIRGVEVQGWQ